MINSELYRPCVGILIYKKNYGFWAGKRLDQFKNSWQLPQGGIDEGEMADDAMARELYEETNITSFKVIDKIDNWLYYDLPKDLVKNFWNGQYIGQKQQWYLLEFTGDDSEINIKTKIAEFSDWGWYKTDFILKNIVDFKLNIYQEIFNKWPERLIYQ